MLFHVAMSQYRFQFSIYQIHANNGRQQSHKHPTYHTEHYHTHYHTIAPNFSMCDFSLVSATEEYNISALQATICRSFYVNVSVYLAAAFLLACNRL